MLLMLPIFVLEMLFQQSSVSQNNNVVQNTLFKDRVGLVCVILDVIQELTVSFVWIGYYYNSYIWKHCSYFCHLNTFLIIQTFG